jgi:DNA repair protein RecN (Recombination protein N)
MLTDLYIENFTVVERLSLSLNDGLCVLSGETGAGKSIIVDAVQFALGRRSDTQEIRHGANLAEVTLIFDIQSRPAIKAWLEEHGFDHQECIISRSLNRDGRSRSRLNGKPCPAHVLRLLAPQILLIHGQHDAYTLMQRERQQQFVDALGKHQAWLDALSDIHRDYQHSLIQIDNLKKEAASRHQRLAFLEYQQSELLALNPGKHEWENLHQEHNQLQHANSLIAHMNQACILLNEHDEINAQQLLHQTILELQQVSRFYPEIQDVITLLETARIHVEEASDELQRRRERLELNPERLQYINERLSTWHDLARKHHVSPESLHELLLSIEEQIKNLHHHDENLDQLHDQLNELKKRYKAIATPLSQSRQRFSEQIETTLTASMQDLGMEGGEFFVRLEAHTETQDELLHADGLERIQFWVKTNPGHAAQPLQKVVSGGELSRLALALQTISLEQSSPGSLIFDEVDAGIGGKTAEMVGRLLKTLAKHHQVLCITHLPQVAAQGDHHYLVTKIINTLDKSTHSQIHLLNADARIEELARMLSGSQITESTRQHAKELIGLI